MRHSAGGGDRRCSASSPRRRRRRRSARPRRPPRCTATSNSSRCAPAAATARGRRPAPSTAACRRRCGPARSPACRGGAAMRPQAVVAGQPAADLDPHRPGGRSSSSCTITIRSGRRCRSDGRARPTAWPESFMYVSGKASTTRRSPMRDLGDEGVLRPALSGDSCRRGQLADHLVADVVAGAGELLARVAQPDDQPVGRGRRPAPCASAVTSDHSAAVAAVGRSLGVVTLGLLLGRCLVGGLDLGHLGAHRQHGDDRGLGVADRGDAGGQGEVADADDVSDLQLADVDDELVGDVARRRDARRSCRPTGRPDRRPGSTSWPRPRGASARRP